MTDGSGGLVSSVLGRFIEGMDLVGKTLVVFGCGYLGSRVAHAAVEAGMEVTALTRNRLQAEKLSREGVPRVITAELDAPEWHPLIDPRQDFVLDCVSSGGGGLEGYRRSYLEGMRSILRWAGRGEIGTLLFTSSTSVYAQDHGGWVTEADPAEGASEGGRILRQAEMLLEEAPAAVRRGIILRLGGIYGPGRHHLLDRALREGPVGEGEDCFLNSIHIDDAVAAVGSAFRAADTVDCGIFNIVDDHPTPKGEIVHYLREQIKKRGCVASEPDSDHAGGARRNTPRPNRRISNRKARELQGWRPSHPDYRSGYQRLLEQRG